MSRSKILEANPIVGIYLDMDGPLVDDIDMFSKLDPFVKETEDHLRLLRMLGLKQQYVFPLIQKGISLKSYENASLTSFATVLKTVLLPLWKEKGIKVEILSSTMSENKERENLANQKKNWLKKHGFGHLPCHLVEGSTKKQDYAKEGWLLIDDFDRTIGQFISKGGFGLQYVSLNQTMKDLRLLNLAPQVLNV